VRSHKLKLLVPAAIVSASLFVLTLGVAAAQAAASSGRTAGVDLPAAGRGATNVGVVAAGVVILAVVIGAIVYLVLADRRQPTPAAAAEPATLHRDSSETGQDRKAA
jgi:hypothetical protein